MPKKELSLLLNEDLTPVNQLNETMRAPRTKDFMGMSFENKASQESPSRKSGLNKSVRFE